ncbi:hypothetical protein BH23GEM9_BH23GEM9_00100 [soil metagenome]
MNGRIQRALDGEIPITELNETERRELLAYQRVIDASLDVGQPERPAPDVSAAVMWRIRQLEPVPDVVLERGTAGTAGLTGMTGFAARLRQAARWLLTPQPVSLRPAAVFGVVLLVVALFGAGMSSSGNEAASEPEAARLLVQFRMITEGAREVALVGDFSGWEGRHALEQVAPGVWSTTIPLEPGLYDYAFVVDGETWQLDPLAPAVADGFGGANSRIAVLAPETTAL